MKTQEEIEAMANDFVSLAFNKQDLYDGFIKGYTQCQEDRKHFLSKETLDELFNLHDEDDFIDEDSDKKYTEEDMQICWNTAILVFAKNRPILFKDYIKL